MNSASEAMSCPGRKKEKNACSSTGIFSYFFLPVKLSAWTTAAGDRVLIKNAVQDY